MSRKEDLENIIRTSYQLVQEYEEIRQYTGDPKEKHRAERAINEQKALISGYLSEYVPLCRRLGMDIAPDISELASSVGFSSPPGDEASHADPTDATPDRASLIYLHEVLRSRFSEGELRTLCFNLGLDYDSLPGSGKSDKARENNRSSLY